MFLNLDFVSFYENEKANRWEPKSCLGWVFHFKLGRVSVMDKVHGANAQPCLKLNAPAS